MLLPVAELRPLPRSRRARWLSVLLLGASLAGAVLPARSAFAQESTDNGWFEPSPAPSPDYYDGAPVPPAPSPSIPPPVQQPQQAPVDDTDPSALTTFKPALDPYGAWVADPTYGTVWVPNREVVGSDFAPYVSRGHWALTADDDWIWVSDYPFGWAVFHYGRWVWISGQGWAWVPGRTYANAWVVWRVPTSSYAYVGWAPMPPAWGWYNGYAVGLWWSPPLPYVFCPSAYVFDYRVHYHIVHDHRMVRDIAANTRVYPTPYHTPARPNVRGGGPGPGARTAAAPTGGVPRGPQMSAARVPQQALPSTRTAAPAAAARLAGPPRVVRTPDFGNARPDMSVSRDRFVPQPQTRMRASSPAPTRVPSDSRVFGPSDSFRRPSSGGWVNQPRPSAPARVRVEPRSIAPAPRVAPSAPRSFSPPVRSSFTPMRSHGGGSFRRR